MSEVKYILINSLLSNVNTKIINPEPTESLVLPIISTHNKNYKKSQITRIMIK